VPRKRKKESERMSLLNRKEATCCIEKDILDKIDLEIVINDFASRNARRSFFVKH
jgi:hypothetical protein